MVANGRHTGRAADVWVWRVDDDQGYGTYHNVYTFLAGRVRDNVVFLKVSVNGPKTLKLAIGRVRVTGALARGRKHWGVGTHHDCLHGGGGPCSQ